MTVAAPTRAAYVTRQSLNADRDAPHSILTWTGRIVDPWDMRPEDITLEDIAHALSLQCRFAGHIPSHYSVAEHSFRGAQRLRVDGASELVQRAFLLHDAAEAYLTDLPKPLKSRPEFAEYVKADDRLSAVIARKWGFSFQHPSLGPVVKSMDRAMYAWEVQNIRTGQQHGLSGAQAEDMYLTWAHKVGIR